MRRTIGPGHLGAAMALALFVAVASGSAHAEPPPLARWKASLDESYRHYDTRSFAVSSDAPFEEMWLGDCWMAHKFSESPKRATTQTTQAKRLIYGVLKTKERAFPNIGIGIYELRRPDDLSVLDTGCWPSNQAMVQVQGGRMLAQMIHTCRGTSYFRYDTADFLRALEEIGFPMDHIFVTRCGRASERVTKEEVYERGEAKRSVWKKWEPAHRNAIKEAPRKEKPKTSQATES